MGETEQTQHDADLASICSIPNTDIRALLIGDENAFEDVKVFMCNGGELFKIKWDLLFDYLSDFVIPAGIVLDWFGDTEPPRGWLLCDGSSFDTSKYPELNKVCAGGKVPKFDSRHTKGIIGDDSISTTGGSELFEVRGTHFPDHSHEYETITCNIAKAADHATGVFENNDGRSCSKGWKQYVLKMDPLSGNLTNTAGRTLDITKPYIIANKIIKAH